MCGGVMTLAFSRVIFEGSFPSESSCPDFNKPEIAFIGRSNVGKSSFLNALWGRRELAHTSKKPGKTALINFFNVDESFMCVDLPGYGYARTSKDQKNLWRRMIPDYIERRVALMHVFLLIDSRHIHHPKDVEALSWLTSLKRPTTLILTKSDKVKAEETLSAVESLKCHFGYDVFTVTVKDAKTFIPVREHIGHLLKTLSASREAEIP